MAIPKNQPESPRATGEFFRVTFERDNGKTKPTEENGGLQNLIWDTRTPLGLGYPFSWAVERTPQGIRVRRLDGARGRALPDSVKEVTFTDLSGHNRIPLQAGLEDVRDGKANWIILNPVMATSNAALSDTEIAALSLPQAAPSTIDDDFFTRTLIQTLIGTALITGALWLLPTPKTDVNEVIPPQFAKLLLKPAQRTDPAKAKRDAPVQSTRETNVVRAFESKALQNTAKKVIALGKIAGLSKSALLGGLGSAAAATKVFSGKSGASAFKGLDSSLLTAPAKTGSIGGGKNGTYGNSTVIGVRGQGNRQLAFDPSAIEVADGLDKDQVGKTIREHVGEIRYCYETALVRNPSLEGKLLVTFVISLSGSVKSATNKQTNADAGLVKCILDHLKKWNFPKPGRGTEVEVSYPFIFKSIGG